MALSLEEILNKATIKFPWDLTIEQSIGLMRYIEKKLPIFIRYDFLHSVKIGRQFGYDVRLNEEKASAQDGTISLSNPPFTNAQFQFKPLEKDISKLEAIQFPLPKDFENTEYNPEVVQLWENVKKAVDDYFEENPE